MLTPADNPARATRWDWQATMVNGLWAGINTSTPNMLVREGFDTGVIPEFHGYESIRAEVPFGEGSRVDAVLSGPRGDFYVEAKNVTLVVGGRALFPDAVTVRGAKHLDELARLTRRGGRAAMFYLVQRMDADSAGPAAHIDPFYRERLAIAVDDGVEIIAWRARTTPEGVFLDRALPFVMDI
jgi:sugar fermentation stimulation protein A